MPEMLAFFERVWYCGEIEGCSKAAMCFIFGT